MAPFLISLVMAKTIVSYRSGESDGDKRHNYEKNILELALEKTKGSYGDFELRPSEVMNFTRAINDLEKNITHNLILRLSYDSKLRTDKIDFAQFPIDLGIVGYRVCLTNTKTLNRLKTVKNIDDLKKFTHGQGQQWTDVSILRFNQFTVFTSTGYENLFRMVALGRFDLFCRGVNEILYEFNSHKNIKGLELDESFAIVYPLPRFFYTNKNNKRLIARIEEGLLIAYKDGSLKKLWMEEYEASVKSANLGQRKIYRLENNDLNSLKFDYQKYFVDPIKDYP